MRVLVDTSVWSLALRRRQPGDGPVEAALRRLVQEGRVVLIGPIRQEILSGVRHEEQFVGLRDQLRSFPELALRVSDYEDAAGFSNLCRARGIQGSNTDFLICAVAARYSCPIFTTDGDFTLFARLLPIRLLEVQ